MKTLEGMLPVNGIICFLMSKNYKPCDIWGAYENLKGIFINSKVAGGRPITKPLFDTWTSQPSHASLIILKQIQGQFFFRDKRKSYRASVADYFLQFADNNVPTYL